MDFTDHTSTLVAAVLSFFIPAVAAFLRSHSASSAYAGVLVFVICIVGAFASMILTDTLITDVPTADTMLLIKLWLENFFTAAVGAITFYNMLYKPSGVADALEKRGKQLGAATGPTPETDTSHKPPIA